MRTQPWPDKLIQPRIGGAKRKALPIESVPRKPKVTPEMGVLLHAVCGKDAFHRLRSLIYSWRDLSKSMFEISRRDAAVQLVRIVDALETKSHLTEFLERFAKVKLAEVRDEGKDGRLFADPIALTNLMTNLKWHNTKKNRTKLSNHLQEGGRWKRTSRQFRRPLVSYPCEPEGWGKSPTFWPCVRSDVGPGSRAVSLSFEIQ